MPDDVLMIQYEWRTGGPQCSGMNQHNELTGQAAVDMLIGMLHRREKGLSYQNLFEIGLFTTKEGGTAVSAVLRLAQWHEN